MSHLFGTTVWSARSSQHSRGQTIMPFFFSFSSIWDSFNVAFVFHCIQRYLMICSSRSSPVPLAVNLKEMRYFQTVSLKFTFFWSIFLHSFSIFSLAERSRDFSHSFANKRKFFDTAGTWHWFRIWNINSDRGRTIRLI